MLFYSKFTKNWYHYVHARNYFKNMIQVIDLSLPEKTLKKLAKMGITDFLDIICYESAIVACFNMTELSNIRYELERFGVVVAHQDGSRLIKRG